MTSLLGFFQPEAGHLFEFEDDAVVYQAVDGRGGGHLVLEDFVPLGKGQVAGEHDRATLIAVGEQVEEDLHLLARLLDIANVVEDQGMVSVG
mgnify:CR=1 FL=1